MKKLNDIIEFFKLLKLRYIGNVPYQNISLVGLVLGFMGYNNLERNWVPINLLLTITVVSSIFITLIFFKYYKRELNLIWAIFHNLSIGLLVASLFISSNDFLSNKPEIEKQYHIKDLKLLNGFGRRKRNLTPEFIIEINDEDRVFTVHHARFKQFVHNRKVYLTLKKGFWGFDIVKSLKFEDEI